jgi:hypothetical protein
MYIALPSVNTLRLLVRAPDTNDEETTQAFVASEINGQQSIVAFKIDRLLPQRCSAPRTLILVLRISELSSALNDQVLLRGSYGYLPSKVPLQSQWSGVHKGLHVHETRSWRWRGAAESALLTCPAMAHLIATGLWQALSTNVAHILYLLPSQLWQKELHSASMYGLAATHDLPEIRAPGEQRACYARRPRATYTRSRDLGCTCMSRRWQDSHRMLILAKLDSLHTLLLHSGICRYEIYSVGQRAALRARLICINIIRLHN